MRTSSVVPPALAVAVALLYGCSGNSPVSLSPIPGSPVSQPLAQSSLRGVPTSSGVAQPSSSSPAGASDSILLTPAAYAGLKDIYVSDLGFGAVQLFKNKGYFRDGSISSGLSFPAGNFLDLGGNLYVADYGITAINEYPAHGSTPSHTYNAGMVFPVNVTVDRHGNVFESDYGNGGQYNGFVAEYPQGTNKVLRSCSPGGSVQGVAVDRNGDVFVDFNLNGQGKIVEYSGGLKGCGATPLGATLSSAGGMAIDKNKNLIVCDLIGHVIDVIAPPYSTVTRTMGPSYGAPGNVAVNRDNSKVFASDAGNAAVYVIDYASGTTIATIKGYYFGLTAPSGVVDGPNAVY